MFDNVVSQNRSNQPSEDQLSPRPIAPVGDFSSGSTARSDEIEQKVNDIFSETERGINSLAPKPLIFQPKDLPVPKVEPMPDPEKSAQKYFVLGFIVLTFVFLALGGYWGYRVFFGSSSGYKSDSLPYENKEEKTDNAEKEADGGVVVKNDDNQGAMFGKTEIPAPDSDQDGLSDDEESKLGTDKYGNDTDNDGLYDKEEVKTYKTDPVKADTDGDGYLDGDEVKNGYNPKGEGILYELN